MPKTTASPGSAWVLFPLLYAGMGPISEAETKPLETGGMLYAPVGIGGWLILPIIHLVGNAGYILYQMITEFMKGYSEAVPPAEGATRTINLSAAAMACSIAFVLFMILMVFYAFYCLVRLFQKKQSVPRLMITFYVLLLIMVGTNYFFLVQFPELQESSKDTSEAIGAIVRMVIAAAIWIPYFLTSVRVKNTFVR